jgi:hypothetical protein
MDGDELLRGLRTGMAARPPWIPLLGLAAAHLGQVDESAFTANAQEHAMAVAQAAGALSADVVTVGLGTDPAVGVDAVRRIEPLLAGRGVAGCLSVPDVAGARAYCEAGAGMVLLVRPDWSAPGRFRTLANACAFYQALAILVDPDLEDAAGVAAPSSVSTAPWWAPRPGTNPALSAGASPRHSTHRPLPHARSGSSGPSPPRSHPTPVLRPSPPSAPASPADDQAGGTQVTIPIEPRHTRLPLSSSPRGTEVAPSSATATTKAASKRREIISIFMLAPFGKRILPPRHHIAHLPQQFRAQDS